MLMDGQEAIIQQTPDTCTPTNLDVLPEDGQTNEGELSRRIELQSTAVVTTVGLMTEAESGEGSIKEHEVKTIPKAKRASTSTYKKGQQQSKLKDAKKTTTLVVTVAKVSTVKPKEVKRKDTHIDTQTGTS